MSKLVRISLLVLFFHFCSGCTSSMATAQHHRTSANVLPKQIALVPVEVSVTKYGLGSTTEVPGWSEEANKVVDASIKKYVKENLNVNSSPIESLNSEDELKLEEYVGLYDATAGAILTSQTGSAAWKHKQDRFDYTLGDKLSFLKEHTDSEAALFVVGTNYVSTGGRKLAFILAAAVGVAIPLGHSFLHVGLVDIGSGDILWTNSAISQTLNLRDPSNVESIISTLFESYPK